MSSCSVVSIQPGTTLRSVPVSKLQRNALLLTIVLAGCAAVGPDYQPPQPSLPPQWNASGEVRALDTQALAQWWQQFGDPVLDALVTDALVANLDLATAQAQLREARARRALAGAQLGPSVTVGAAGSRSKSSAQSGSGNTRELYSAGFDASWEPDIFGGARRGLEAAQADVGARIESLGNAWVSLVAEVVLNYIDLRTAEQRLAIAEASLRARSETYDLARWRQQAGLVSELDVAQARTDLESTRAALPGFRTQRSEAQNRLAVLLGRTPGELQARLAATASIPLPGAQINVGIPADTLRQRPDVRVAERRLAAQTARLVQAEAARYPSFNLTGSLGVEALTLGALGNGGAGSRSLLAGITAPIFDTGRIRANIGIQDALLEQAQIDYRSAVLIALEDVENALIAVVNTTERRAQLVQAVRSARATRQIAEQRYTAGLSDFLSVLDAQRTLLSLEDQLASSTGELASAQIRLYKALGGGWSASDTALKEMS